MLLLACKGECCSRMFYISPSPHGQWSNADGRVVKVLDSKSNELFPNWFESCLQHHVE